MWPPLDLLKRRKLKTQIWYLLVGLGQEDKVAKAARGVAYLAYEAGKIGCSVALQSRRMVRGAGERTSDPGEGRVRERGHGLQLPPRPASRWTAFPSSVPRSCHTA
jgi:hypothetical protein